LRSWDVYRDAEVGWQIALAKLAALVEAGQPT
jgi:hypothetical protein